MPIWRLIWIMHMDIINAGDANTLVVECGVFLLTEETVAWTNDQMPGFTKWTCYFCTWLIASVSSERSVHTASNLTHPSHPVYPVFGKLHFNVLSPSVMVATFLNTKHSDIFKGSSIYTCCFSVTFLPDSLNRFDPFLIPWVSFSCQPITGSVKAHAARSAPLAYFSFFLFFFLYVCDWFPHLTALDGLNFTSTSGVDRLHLACAAKPNRQPVCLVNGKMCERRKGAIKIENKWGNWGGGDAFGFHLPVGTPHSNLSYLGKKRLLHLIFYISFPRCDFQLNKIECNHRKCRTNNAILLCLAGTVTLNLSHGWSLNDGSWCDE